AAALMVLALLVSVMTRMVLKKLELNELELSPEIQAYLDKGFMAASVLLVVLLFVSAIPLVVIGWQLLVCKGYKTCLALTGIQSVLLFPVGTVLGAYTFKVLRTPAVKAQFHKTKSAG